MSDLRDDEKKFKPKEKEISAIAANSNRVYCEKCGIKTVEGIVWGEKQPVVHVFYCWKCRHYTNEEKD